MPNLPLHFKEAKGNTTEFTEKLAGYSTGNESRDYFRNNELPEPLYIKVPIKLADDSVGEELLPVSFLIKMHATLLELNFLFKFSRFSAKSLVRETTYGWFLNCKGYNARVVSEWLMYKLIEVNQQPEFQVGESADVGEIPLWDWRAINRYFGLTERTSRKLSFVSTITIMASSVAEGHCIKRLKLNELGEPICWLIDSSIL
ncbi:unnamed protein product [Cladocopium goreaui]|uniref:Transposase n=1 Tax=Cladocopium goreaui TaxID=2562237 RepID=A0A9P1DL97_9DINO|nr:unnamed protein product [Cladocopium goreaui]